MTHRIVTSFKRFGERGIGLGKKISDSLSAQLLCSVFISLFVAAAAAILSFWGGSALLDHTVYGRPFAQKMVDRQFSDLQEYVTAQQITTENILQLNAWCHQGRKIYLVIYQDDQLIFAPSKSGEIPESDDWSMEEEDSENQYELMLSDGTSVYAFLYYYAGDAFYLGITILSALIAFAAFSACFVLLIHRKLAYIKKLKAELDILSGGALEYPVTVQGKDELGQLAYGIDQMRCSILAHQRTEEMARSANSQLVTAMSHDLRTPLTSLLAYLELIDRGKYESEEKLHLFVRKSLDKTYRIKTLADQIFEYFLVYSAEWEQPDLESQDADMLLGPIWSDYAFSLENKEFSIHTDFQPLNGTVQVNMELLRRVFDNLYSNLLKYADPGKTVEIAVRKVDGQAQLRIVNHVSPSRDKRESTRIGLNTCQRIMEYHSGIFEYTEENGVFAITLTLPIYP